MQHAALFGVYAVRRPAIRRSRDATLAILNI
jgi:hypothetical protein